MFIWVSITVLKLAQHYTDLINLFKAKEKI